MRLVEKGATVSDGGLINVNDGSRTRSCIDDDNQPVQPGEIGRMARGGNVPLGYYKDPVKTAATFIEVDGKRYSVPGDFARLELDGTMTLLGRGSQCINSGGEKIYPEEVESALKAHPKVFDVLVVGVDDERWGQKVAAVVQPRPGEPPTLDELVEHCRTRDRRLQGAARSCTSSTRCPRQPSGKPDYPRATAIADGRDGGARMKNRLTEMFGIEYPIFAFSHCRDVVAAVTNAGGMGVLGALAFSPEQLELELKWIDEHVDGKPYGVDVVMPVKTVDRDAGLDDVERHRRAAARDDPPGRTGTTSTRSSPTTASTSSDDAEVLEAGAGMGAGVLGWTEATGAPQIEIALAHPIALLASALGPPPKAAIDQAHEQGVKVAALIGRVEQARARRAAGRRHHHRPGLRGRRPHRRGRDDGAACPTWSTRSPRSRCSAAGGIGSGRQMAAAMALGADGVWTGSIWLTVDRERLGGVVTEKLLAATSTDTVRSRALHRQAGPPAAHRVDRGVGGARVARHAADAAAVHPQLVREPQDGREPAPRARRHAGRSDRQPHEPGAHHQAGRVRDGRGVRRRHPKLVADLDALKPTFCVQSARLRGRTEVALDVVSGARGAAESRSRRGEDTRPARRRARQLDRVGARPLGIASDRPRDRRTRLVEQEQSAAASAARVHLPRRDPSVAVDALSAMAEADGEHLLAGLAIAGHRRPPAATSAAPRVVRGPTSTRR